MSITSEAHTLTVGTLHIELRIGESLQVGDALITLGGQSGRRARLAVQAPKSLTVRRNINPSAQERAPQPEKGKEHPHAKSLYQG